VQSRVRRSRDAAPATASVAVQRGLLASVIEVRCSAPSAVGRSVYCAV
jgi:hypothetical protein